MHDEGGSHLMIPGARMARPLLLSKHRRTKERSDIGGQRFPLVNSMDDAPRKF